MIEAAIEANHSKVVHFRVAVPLVSLATVHQLSVLLQVPNTQCIKHVQTNCLGEKRNPNAQDRSEVHNFNLQFKPWCTCASGGHTIGSYHAPVAKSCQHTNIQSTSCLATGYIVIKAEAVVPVGSKHIFFILSIEVQSIPDHSNSCLLLPFQFMHFMSLRHFISYSAVLLSLKYKCQYLYESICHLSES